MNLEELRARKGFICDMDGVIYLGNQLLPGVAEFVTWLNENDKRFLFLTNSSERSPKELHTDDKLASAFFPTDRRSVLPPALPGTLQVLQALHKYHI